jgi:hypothetical protein
MGLPSSPAEPWVAVQDRQGRSENGMPGRAALIHGRSASAPGVPLLDESAHDNAAEGGPALM